VLTYVGLESDDVRVRRVVCLIAAAVALGAAAPAPALQIGISDQHATMFSDPLYAPLQLRYARLVVPWNVAVKKSWVTQATADWLFAAALAHTEPHIAFSSPEYTKFAKNHPPTPKQYLRAVQAFHRRWPAVRVFTTWNEENFYFQPTAQRPELAARFYDILWSVCPGCQIVAADVLDQPNLTTWIKRFKAAVRHKARIWGLHNYKDVNRHAPLRDSWTLRFAGMVKGDIWDTEAGGIVGLKSPASGKTVFPYSPRRAATSMRYLFKLITAPQVGNRYRRAYVYSFYGAWDGKHRTNRWDSGLLGLDGKPRPAYGVLEQLLNRFSPPHAFILPVALRRHAGR
jgi:hypothetical protein